MKAASPVHSSNERTNGPARIWRRKRLVSASPSLWVDRFEDNHGHAEFILGQAPSLAIQEWPARAATRTVTHNRERRNGDTGLLGTSSTRPDRPLWVHHVEGILV